MFDMLYRDPEPPVEPPESRYITDWQDHEVYDGETVYINDDDKVLCSDCMREIFDEQFDDRPYYSDQIRALILGYDQTELRL